MPDSLVLPVVLVAVVVGFGLRLPTPGLPPPGLYRDEAYNGLDAASVLDGEHPLYFPANNGREPLFIYLTSGFVWVLGRTPAPPRLAAAFVGTAAIAAAFAVGRMLLGRRTAVLTAALFAVAPWPVLLARVGLRAGLLPLVLSLAVAATVKGARSRDRRWIAFGGALAGLTVYTYLAAWAGLALVGFFMVWFAVRGRQRSARRAARAPAGSPGAATRARAGMAEPPPPCRDEIPKAGPRAPLLWTCAALAVALPLLIAYAGQAPSGSGRAAQVSVLEGVEPGEQLGVVAHSAARAAGLFVWRGDTIPRHNIPGRPVLAPLGAAAWLLGLAVLLRRARHEPGAAVALAWLAAMLLPTALAKDAPHFLRAAGLLPAAFFPAGLGVAWIGGQVRLRRPALVWVGPLIAAAVVAGELDATLDYFVAGSQGDARARLYHAFESGAVGLAADVNNALAAGWIHGWSVPAGSAAADEAGSAAADESVSAVPAVSPVWLDRRLRDGWASVPYLVSTDLLTLTDPYDPILTSVPGRAYVWPHDLDLPNIWSRRPGPMRLDARPGSYEQGDLETEPRLLYLVFEATRPEPIVDPLGRFANGVVLAEANATVDGDPVTGIVDRLHITTEWSVDRPIDRDVTAFVQVLDGDRLIDSSDAPLGEGRFPVPYWMPGDRIVEARSLHVAEGVDLRRHRVVVGTYEWPSVVPIRVTLPDGSESDHVPIRAAGPVAPDR